MGNIELTILISGTALIIALNWWASIKDGRYHGIPRIFAFESVLILALLNFRSWFENPFSTNQIASWILLALSIPSALSGVIFLKLFGKSQDKFENTTELVVAGPFRYIRHPMYLSLFLLAAGILLKNINVLTISLATKNGVAVFITAKMEEKILIHKFGNRYIDYMKKTKMFIPYIL